MTITRRSFAKLSGAAILAGALGRAGQALSADRLEKRLAEIEADLGARLGVVLLDTGTGRRWAHRPDERFPMCSTFKVVASAALLARVDAGYEDLERRVTFEAADLVSYSPVTETRVGAGGMSFAEVCEAAITRSDNTAGNILIDALRGPSGVTEFARSIGDGMTRLDRWETDLNEARPGDPRDTTTPAAMAGSLQALVLGDVLSPASRERLAGWMIGNKTGDARLRAGLPSGWRVGDKTGTGDFGTANDIAVIWPPTRAPLVASVYVTETEASLDARNAAFAAIARDFAGALAA